jgi:hypothetical protein
MFRWMIILRETGQVIQYGWASTEDNYRANQAACPPICDFIDMPNDASYQQHVGSYMAWDPDTKAFFYDKAKVDASGLTLAEIKTLLTEKPEAAPTSRNVWDSWPKTKPTRAE